MTDTTELFPFEARELSFCILLSGSHWLHYALRGNIVAQIFPSKVAPLTKDNSPEKGTIWSHEQQHLQ